MIDKSSAEILKLINGNKHADILDYDTLAFLENNNYVAYDGKKIAYVTNDGKAALEEFELKQCEIELSKDAVNIARISDKKSTISIVCSVVEAFMSIAAFAISIIALVASCSD